MSLLHTRFTPTVINKSIDKARVRDFAMGQGTCRVIIEEGSMDGEVFSLHDSRIVHLSEEQLAVELDKTVVGTDTVRQALERAVLAALETAGELGEGSLG